MHEHATYPIVIFSPVRWNSDWQRPQQFSSLLGKRHLVFFVEEPVFDVEEDALPRLEMTDTGHGVVVIRFHVWPKTSPTALDTLRSFFFVQAMEQSEPLHNGEFPLFWYYNPMDLHWSISLWPCCSVVYDCTENLAQIEGASCELSAEENHLLQYAEIVLVGSSDLLKVKSREHANVHLVADNVESVTGWERTTVQLESLVRNCLREHYEALSS